MHSHYFLSSNVPSWAPVIGQIWMIMYCMRCKLYFSLGAGIMELLHRFEWMRVGILYSDNGKDRKCYYVNEGLQSLIHTGHTQVDTTEVKADGERITDEEIDNYLDKVVSRNRSQYFAMGSLKR